MKIFNVFKFILDFIYPPICILCDQKHNDLKIICPNCINILVNSAQLHFKNHPSDFHHLTEHLHFDGIYYFWEYTPEIQQLIHQLKYNECTKIAAILGLIMSDHLDINNKVDFIIPIPLHKVRKRERGYNQSEEIAKILSSHFSIEMETTILKRTSYTQTQTYLTAEERQKNLMDAFKVISPKIIHKSVLLVDDVITTGSTLNTCAKILKSAGATQVIGCSIARPKLNLLKESA